MPTGHLRGWLTVGDKSSQVAALVLVVVVVEVGMTINQRAPRRQDI